MSVYAMGDGKVENRSKSLVALLLQKKRKKKYIELSQILR